MKNKYVFYKEVSPSFFYIKTISNFEYKEFSKTLHFNLENDKYKMNNVYEIKCIDSGIDTDDISGKVIFCDFEYTLYYKNPDIVNICVKMSIENDNGGIYNILIQIKKEDTYDSNIVEDIPIYKYIEYGVYHEFLIEFFKFSENLNTYMSTEGDIRYTMDELLNSRICILDIKVENNKMFIYNISYGLNGIINKYLKYDSIKDIIPKQYSILSSIEDCKACFKIISNYINNL